MLFILDIMQVTFVTKPFVDLPTTSFNSQGLGTQAKTSNVAQHMPTQFQLYVPWQQAVQLGSKKFLYKGSQAYN